MADGTQEVVVRRAGKEVEIVPTTHDLCLDGSSTEAESSGVSISQHMGIDITVALSSFGQSQLWCRATLPFPSEGGRVASTQGSRRNLSLAA